MGFERVDGETVWEGKIFSVRRERFRHDDGETVTREFVHHEGAVAILAHDEEHVVLVRQPREPVGEQALLELPAGRLDRPGEDALRAAQRELAEEVGLAAEHWEHMRTILSSAGFADEVVHLFRASGLHPAAADSGENERIEIVRWPLADLDAAIAATRDAKTLVGLLELARRPRP